MKGKELHRLVKASGNGVAWAMKEFDLSRQGLYDLYKRDVVEDKYVTRAKELGLTKLDLSEPNQGSVILSAATIWDMYLRSEKERQELSKALQELSEAHSELLKRKLKAN